MISSTGKEFQISKYKFSPLNLHQFFQFLPQNFFSSKKKILITKCHFEEESISFYFERATRIVFFMINGKWTDQIIIFILF